MKQRNPNWGCPRIAQQIALALHIQIDKDVVRKILGHHYRPGQDSDGPSWLTFLGHTSSIGRRFRRSTDDRLLLEGKRVFRVEVGEELISCGAEALNVVWA
jgi:hypothetical protein